MVKQDDSQKNTSPTVKISLVNYDSAWQTEYSTSFMSPLVEGLLRRLVQQS